MSRILQLAEGESLSDLGFAIQSLATVRGYVRALEDVLEDMNEIGSDDWGMKLEARILKSLHEARQTLEKLS